MSFTKTAKLNLGGGGGWDADMVALWLNTYAEEMIPHYTEKWLKSLGTRAEYQADAAYKTTVKFSEDVYPLAPTTVTSSVEGNVLTIDAEGPEVTFSEFGAGLYAEAAENELAAKPALLGFAVAPGTYSMGPEGAKTFLMTDAAKEYGYPPGPIPLAEWAGNVIPGRGLLAAWNDIKKMYEVFGQLAFQDDTGID